MRSVLCGFPVRYIYIRLCMTCHVSTSYIIKIIPLRILGLKVI